jgi:hypothetical protein
MFQAHILQAEKLSCKKIANIHMRFSNVPHFLEEEILPGYLVIAPFKPLECKLLLNGFHVLLVD